MTVTFARAWTSPAGKSYKADSSAELDRHLERELIHRGIARLALKPARTTKPKAASATPTDTVEPAGEQEVTS